MSAYEQTRSRQWTLTNALVVLAGIVLFLGSPLWLLPFLERLGPWVAEIIEITGEVLAALIIAVFLLAAVFVPPWQARFRRLLVIWDAFIVAPAAVGILAYAAGVKDGIYEPEIMAVSVALLAEAIISAVTGFWLLWYKEEHWSALSCFGLFLVSIVASLAMGFVR